MPGVPDILLVDDDPQLIRVLKEALEEGGYQVTATTSGSDALLRIEEQRPALVILDLNMPEPDGFELLKTARGSYPELKILVISGYLQGALLEAAIAFGAVATLQKPVLAGPLLQKVGEVLGRER